MKAWTLFLPSALLHPAADDNSILCWQGSPRTFGLWAEGENLSPNLMSRLPRCAFSVDAEVSSTPAARTGCHRLLSVQ